LPNFNLLKMEGVKIPTIKFSLYSKEFFIENCNKALIEFVSICANPVWQENNVP